MTTSAAPGTAYELTLEGELGPVLLHALGPGVCATRRQDCVLLTASGSSGRDRLIALLSVLEAHGCEVWEVTAR